jgi:2-polyprenyl-6-methoxyphenol hydroxylase-like FAD-dependent oxidoreductase
MTAVNRVAIAGGGVAGSIAAILLAERGVHVDIFEIKPSVSALGSGITLQGNALRVFDRVGIWKDVERLGYSFNMLGLRAPGLEAPLIATVPDSRTGGPEYPATVGMFRPELAQLLVDRATEVGVHVHFNTGVNRFTSDQDGVDVTLSSGETRRYDLLVGADGLNSRIRTLMGIETTPERTGHGAFRAFVQRPADATNAEVVYGGPCYIAGFCPTSEDMMYAYLIEDWRDRSDLTPEEGVAVMAELSQSYGGPWNEIRKELVPEKANRVNYTAFTTHFVAGPWNRGRVVIIGDAAHSCPPTVAQGAAQAAEDGYVLGDVLLTRDVVDQELWDEFFTRRTERANRVVDASVQIGKWQLEHNFEADIPGLMRSVAALVTVEP